jgi:hypothetical protein
MPAPPIYTDWYNSLPVQYRDRVHFDPVSGMPACIDVAAGAYTVPGALTDTDRQACRLPPLILRPQWWVGGWAGY